MDRAQVVSREFSPIYRRVETGQVYNEALQVTYNEVCLIPFDHPDHSILSDRQYQAFLQTSVRLWRLLLLFRYYGSRLGELFPTLD
jgi:hypothetical protein